MKTKLKTLLLFLTLLASACAPDPLVGPRGEPGPKGDTGPAGVNGAAGPSGANGSPGLNATPITMVKLCPGESVYPTTFVEYAFCLNGSLYATYSTNGGFTTQLPPGTYNSNAVGSACTFTVSEGCQVSQ